MARHLLGTLELKVGTLQNVGQTISYSTNDFFECFYDDVDDAIEVDLNGSPTTDGPLFETAKGGVTHTFAPLNYAQCHPSGNNTYLEFPANVGVGIGVFPYFFREETPNSNKCTGNDAVPINITGTVVSNESAAGAADGTITVTATGGGASLKYDTKDFIYLIEGSSSNVITGLVKGNHTIWVKDGEGEQASTVVTVGRDGETDIAVYSDLYRVEYNDLNGNTSRVTISDRDYTGSINPTFENVAKNPFSLTYQGENNIFTETVGSKATVGLMSTTNYEFLDLFTQDDKRYLVTWEKDTGSGYETRWKGFIQADFFQEPYQDPPYPTFIIATDGLGKLSQIEFRQDDGDRYYGNLALLNVLLICLNKIGLEQGIREAINMYEDSHNTTASDSPLTQTFVNMDSYYNEDGEGISCLEVIRRILRPFGASLFSANGFWYIVRVEELKNASLDYREFNFESTYVTNSSFSPRVDLKTAEETDRAAALKSGAAINVAPANGKIIAVSNLVKPPTSVQGNFSDPQFTGAPFKFFTGFPGWNFNIIVSSELNGIKGFEPRTENSNWFVLESGPSSKGSSRITTPQLGMVYSQTDKIRFRFKYVVVARGNFFTNQIVSPPYARLKWALYVATSSAGAKQWLQSDGTWTSATTTNVIFVEEFNKELDFEIEATLPDDNSPINGVFLCRMHVVGFRDTDDPDLASESSVISTLEGVTTTNLTGGYRYSLGTSTTNYYYVLTERDNSQLTFPNDEPQYVQPTDYAASTNEKIWELEGKVTSTANIFPETKYSAVDVEYLPASGPAPKTSTITADTLGIPKKVDRSQTVELFHFDTPPEVNNARNIYNNYFMSNALGAPTTDWTRDSESGESRTIQDILTRVYASQTKTPRKKINISFTTIKGSEEISFLSIIRDTFDSNLLYLIRGLTINDRRNEYRVTEMTEISESEDLGAYSGAYSSAYGGNFSTVNE